MATTYISVSDADVYFSGRLDHDIWDAASPDDKLRALITATRLIDRLNFSGDKSVSTQDLEFPRGTDTDYPKSIKIATCESAFCLLDGVDVDVEARSISGIDYQMSMIRKRSDVNVVNEWTIHGIPSGIAWGYIRPFLRDPGSVTVSRVN